MAFSQPFGFLRNRADSKVIEGVGERHEVPSVIDALIFGLRFNITVAQLSTSLETIKSVKALVRSVSPLRRCLGVDDSVDFDKVCMQHLRRRIKGPAEPSTDDFIQSILTDRNGEERKVPFMELFAESGVIIGAGSAITTGLLSSSCYLLASHSECLAKLRKEIDSVMPFAAGDHSDFDQEIVPYDLIIKNLTYLRAVIDETLRLRPPISFALPRRVYAPEGANIAGHHVGQGTIVAVPPYTIHRKASLYSDPEDFKPQRWFQEEGNFDPEKESEIHNLKAYTIPFSQGSRACIGRHIAVVEVQILLATMIRRYDISLVSKDQQLDIFEQFNANPGPLPLIISRRVAA